MAGGKRVFFAFFQEFSQQYVLRFVYRYGLILVRESSILDKSGLQERVFGNQGATIMSEFQQRMQVELPAPSKIFTPWMTTFLILEILGFALIHHAPEFTINNLAISRACFLEGKIWQLVTHGFLESCWWNLIIDCIVLLFFGSALEREIKTGSYFLLWLTVILNCGLLWLLVNVLFGLNAPGIGAGSFAFAQMAAFGMVFWDQKFYLYLSVIKAQYVSWLFIGAGIVLGIQTPLVWVWVGGAGLAYLFMKLRKKIFEEFAGSGGRVRSRSGPRGFVDLD